MNFKKSSFMMNKKENKNRIFEFIISSFIVLITAFSITSCQSANKEENFYIYSFVIDEPYIRKGKSIIEVSCEISNQTIYRINAGNFILDTYQDNGIKLGTIEQSFDLTINNGDTKILNLNFTCDDINVRNAKFVSWTPMFATIWDTHFGWIITYLTIYSLFFIFYIIMEIIDFDNTSDGLLGFSMILTGVTAVASIGVWIWCGVTSGWLPGLLLLGGNILTIILCVIVYKIIKFIKIRKIIKGDFTVNFNEYDVDGNPKSLD